MAKQRRQLALEGFEDQQADSSDDNRGTQVSQPAPPQPTAATAECSLEGRTIYVIDSHSLIFQVFHAIGEMTSPQGEPVNAIFGFARDLLYLLTKKKPDFLICAFDRPGPTFRHELYEQYKADRGEMPDELAVQFPGIRRVIESLDIPLLENASYEADDILATIATKADRAGANCFLVTGDKDCRQLITDRVQIYNIRKHQIYDRKSLEKDWGIEPEQVVDFQSLVGDSTDNIPGVARIGPKTATGLLQEYGSLEEVFAHVDDISGAKQNYLRDGRDAATLSRQLVRLVDDVPVEIDWMAAEVHPLDREKILPLFHEFGFRRLSEQISDLEGEKTTPENWQADYQSITSIDALKKLVKILESQPSVSLDVETTSVRPRQAEIVGYSFCFQPGLAYYIPVRAPENETSLDPKEVLELLRPILENPDIEKVGQNLKYDLIVLRSAGVTVRGVAFDTMIASYLLEAGRRSHSLDALAQHHLGHDTIKIETLIGKGKDQLRMDQVPLAKISPYAAEDADVPLRLRPLLKNQLVKNHLGDLFNELEMPLIDVLVEMEYTGIKVDTDLLAKLSHQFGEELKSLETEIYQLAGREFNIASPKQLAAILFDEIGLPVIKKTKSGASTDVDVLEQLSEQHPLPEKIIEYRQFAKLKNTYVDALPSLVYPDTGRVHASFNQVVAATGRLSSSDPNLQNIPIRTPIGRKIRAAFLPGVEGWQLLAADYSQIELRVLAHCTGDEALICAFDRDEDIHTLVASQVYNVPLSDVSPEMRRGAKAVNFGVIYGQSPFGLAKSLNIERDAAAEFIDAYFDRYPRIDEFLDELLTNCQKQGYVSTLFGRRRDIKGVRSETNGRQRNLAERMAINTVIQGSAADLMKRAMIRIHDCLRQESFQANMLLQIHDELIFEVPPEECSNLERCVREEMESAAQLTVPLKVDITFGENWAEV